MKKSLLSVGSLLVVYLLLGSSALALFLPESRLTGMQMTTSDLELMVDVGGGDSPIFVPTDHINGPITLKPEMEPFPEQFWVKNTSSLTERLDLSMYLDGGSGDWEALGDLAQVAIVDPETGEDSGWYSLNEWREAPKSFPNPRLNDGQYRRYEAHYEFADVYPVDPDGDGPIEVGDAIGNEMMDKSITDLTMIIQGTPVTE